MESVWGEFMVSHSRLIHCAAFIPQVPCMVDFWGQMILGLERLKEEVSAPQSLDTHSNLSEFTPSHLLIQVYVLHEAGKWERHVKCRNGVPADLARLSILTSRSCFGLLANRLHTNDQLEVTEDSP